MENNITEKRWEEIINQLEWDLVASNKDYWNATTHPSVIKKEEIEKIISVLKDNVPY